MVSRGQVYAPYGPNLAYMHSNHSKLNDYHYWSSTGKLSVKSQFITHHSIKAIATEWCQLSTRGFDRVC